MGDGWEPIESAPKDGSYVRLLSRECKEIGCWQEERYCMIGAPMGSFGRGWVDETNHLPMYAEFEPTHWRPLDTENADGR